MDNAATHTETPSKQPKRRRWPRRLAIALVALVTACGIGFGLYVSDYYHAPDTASLIEEGSSVSVAETDAYIALGPAESATDQTPVETGIVLYPGAKVDPHAYVPLAEDLAERGMLCVVAKVPFNLAFFGMDAAAGVMKDYPNVESWWVGGHSLGGVAASQFASNHADELAGVILLASYSATDLSNTNLHVLQIYGTNDLVLNRESMDQNAANLPDTTTTLVIEGGNHAGFGAYGPQNGDGEADISAEEQQTETADAIVAFIEGGSLADGAES